MLLERFYRTAKIAGFQNRISTSFERGPNGLAVLSLIINNKNALARILRGIRPSLKGQHFGVHFNLGFTLVYCSEFIAVLAPRRAQP